MTEISKYLVVSSFSVLRFNFNQIDLINQGVADKKWAEKYENYFWL
jgi:hypothetical protein